MKSVIAALCVALVLILVHADLTDEQKQKIQAYGKECISETGVDTELVKKARQGSFTDDAKLKAFTFCMSKKIGFQNDAGEIQTEVVKQKVGKALNNDEVTNNLIAKCLGPKGSSEETAFQSFKCYYENTPTHLTVF